MTLIVDQQQTSSRITLTLQQSFNQQPLTCVAENPRIPQSSALRQTLQLDVHCKFTNTTIDQHEARILPLSLWENLDNINEADRCGCSFVGC